MEHKTTTLDKELLAYRQSFLQKASQEKIESFEQGIQKVIETGILDQAITVGNKAPLFTLQNATGEAVSLEAYLAKGPVILTWYRGGWCPYCNITLRFLQQFLPEFKAKGAQLLALTPELPDQSLSTSEKHQLTFEVLSDVDNHVARSYGLVFQVPDFVMKWYNENFDLSAYNGNDQHELPLAATYIIDSQGIVQYAFLDADYRNRAEPNELLAALDQLQ